MAKAPAPPAPEGRVNNVGPGATEAPEINAATPDNTPLPGGGSWRWSDAQGGWISAEPTPATPAISFPILE